MLGQRLPDFGRQVFLNKENEDANVQTKQKRCGPSFGSDFDGRHDSSLGTNGRN